MPRPRAPYLTRRRWTPADARSALAALRASGLSPAAFAAREGIEAQRLYRWRRQLGARARPARAAPAFVEIRARSAERVEVVLRSGRVLRVSEGVSPSALERLVAVLERESSC